MKRYFMKSLAVMLIMILTMSTFVEVFAAPKKPRPDPNPDEPVTIELLDTVPSTILVDGSFTFTLKATDKHEDNYEWTFETSNTINELSSATKKRSVETQFEYIGNEEVTETFVVTYTNTLTQKTGSYSIDIEVIGANDPPVISGVTEMLLEEDASDSIELTITDPNGDSLTVTTQGPFYGTLSESDGWYTYVPEPDFNTSSTSEYFIVTADDGSAVTSHRVDITVTPVQDKPVVTGSYSIVTEVNQPGSVTIDATDPDGEALFIKETHDNVETSGLTVTYLSSVSVVETVSVFVSDGIDDVLVEIDVQVNQENQAPTITGPDFLELIEDGVGSVILQIVDPDGDEMSIEIVQPSNGTVSQSGDTFTYTPEADFNTTFAPEEFQVNASDGMLTTTHTVTVSVLPKNDPFLPVDDYVTVDSGTEITVDVLANDINLDRDALVITEVSEGITDGANVIVTPTIDTIIDYTVFDGDDYYIGKLYITVNEVVTELVYVALGDSIPSGVSGTGYVDTDYTQHIQNTYGFDVYMNLSKSGHNAVDVKNDLLFDAATIEHVTNADLITLCVGANDIMDAAGRWWSGGPLDKYDIDWEKADLGRDNFEDNWQLIIQEIYRLNSDVNLVAMTIYNPYRKTDSYYPLVDPYFSDDTEGNFGLNHIILNTQELYGYESYKYYVADVYKAFNDHSNKDSLTGFYNFFCDPHPNDDGHLEIFSTHDSILMTIY